jgi:hypothetical protein
MQRWRKLGLVFEPERGWSHAQIPTPDGQRIYFGSRDEQNRTHTRVLELDTPTHVGRLIETPVLSPGTLGCFDDCGAMPSCAVTVGSEKYLYYIGWNTSTSVPYRNSIGLAVGDGLKFERAFEGPILDRHRHEPHFCATPFVMRDGCWRMWYLSCTEWSVVDGKPEARYLIRYTESEDGIDWRKPGSVAIDYLHQNEAIARPWVVKENNLYRMWYCFRSTHGYRHELKASYRIGYAESGDGIGWSRRDDLIQLPLGLNEWDSEMVAYPAIIDWNERPYLLYNGNGFGKSGFGIAELCGA